MPLNSVNIGISIGELPEFCGPNDLADAIIGLRRSYLELHHGDTERLVPISDPGIRRLIQLAYYTSLAVEEGRYSRFRLIVGKTFGNDVRLAATFNTPIGDTETLRRLAPAAADTDSALHIFEEKGTLMCSGSLITTDVGFGAIIGRPNIVGVGLGIALTIRVDGPGRVRVTEAPFTLLLDHRGIRQVVDYGLVKQVRALWGDLAKRMMEVIASNLGNEARTCFGGSSSLAQLIHTVWSKILATTVRKQHGGAFVILPRTGTADEFDIHCKYPAQMHFGNDILGFWEACVSHARAKTDDDRQSATREWSWRRAALFTKAEILAGLSSVDGCVVFDRDLNLLGFGGEIRVDTLKAQTAPRALRNIKTGEITPEEELNQLGTRHRSAYRFAKVHSGASIFVISQDGDLRIFYSDHDNVFGFTGLDAWVHEYESG